MSLPRTVTVVQANGDLRTYKLQEKLVVLRGGITQKIRYLVRVGGSVPQGAPPSRIVHENVRLALPLEGQVIVARALVQMLHMSPDEAARVTGTLKADAEKLTPTQRKKVIHQIRTALKE